mgnify:CR=1 FL=1
MVAWYHYLAPCNGQFWAISSCKFLQNSRLMQPLNLHSEIGPPTSVAVHWSKRFATYICYWQDTKRFAAHKAEQTQTSIFALSYMLTFTIGSLLVFMNSLKKWYQPNLAAFWAFFNSYYSKLTLRIFQELAYVQTAFLYMTGTWLTWFKNLWE